MDRTQSPVKITFATTPDAFAMARVSLLGFEKGEHRPALFPALTGLSTEELLARHTSPEARSMKQGIVGHKTYIKASIQGSGPEQEELIVGFASWSSPSRRRKRSIRDWFLSEIIYPLYRFIFRPTLGYSMPPEAKATFAQLHNDTFGPKGVAEGKKHWDLHVLCVHPDWRRKGVGSALLQWGFDKAEEDGAVVYLTSSPMARPIYLAKGFRVTSERMCKVNGYDLKIPGMIWEPRLPKTPCV
ncbi:hypothetical protein BU17DRAFT_67906 [Hysterangium stoloniferum]|nr:hypothetical protein BU17DRAFT_67906 [Hysterangium stoloniferum]